MSKKKFIIEDWAGNRMFPDKSFDTFEDGWAFVYEKFPEEECFDDIYVI